MTTDNQKIVQAFFLGFFGRKATEQDIGLWASKLDAGYSMQEMVYTFIGTEEFAGRAYKTLGLFQPPGHFYSPLFSGVDDNLHYQDPDTVAPNTRLEGLDISTNTYSETWEFILPHMRMFNPAADSNSSDRYYYNNPNYGYTDSAVLYGMIKSYNPKRIIEVGSGFSSALMLDVLQDSQVALTFIEPYPALLEKLVRPADYGRCHIIKSKLQDVPLETFSNLRANDILFIDSSHVVKSGSDVSFELFHVFPSLAPGVIIHIHDIFFPFEYPRAWVVEEKRSWNEAQFLRAFLSYNGSYQTLLFWDHFWRLKSDLIAQLFPLMSGRRGGAFWLKKVV